MGIFEQASAAIGSPPDHLRLIFCLLSGIPLGAVVPLFPSSRASDWLSANAVHLFSIVVSAWYLFGVLDLFRGWLQLSEMAIVTYLICAWGVRNQRRTLKAGKKPPVKFPWIIFAFAMGQLFLNHVWRYSFKISLNIVEITGTMMVFVLKLVHFGWNLYDGQRPTTELDATQLATRLVEMPSFISFLGYVFFFPSLLIGPAFVFSSYETLTSHAIYVSPKGKEVHPKRILPGRKTASAKRAAIGILFLGAYALLGPSFGYEKILEDAFLSNNFWQRVLYTQVFGFVARTKYYGGWCIAEAGCILSGLGYHPGTGSWDATANVKIFSIEFAQNWKVLLDSWNINTNIFLRECVYKRVAKPGRKPGFKSTMLTFGTSAVWHGVNLAYYFTFLLGGFLQALCRHIRSTIRPFFMPPEGNSSSTVKLLYDVASVIALQVTLNYTVIPFMLLDVRPTVVAWHRLGWYGHALAFAPLLFFWSGAGKTLLRRPAQKQLGGVHAQDRYEAKVAREVEGVKGVDQLGPDISAEQLAKELKRG